MNKILYKKYAIQVFLDNICWYYIRIIGNEVRPFSDLDRATLFESKTMAGKIFNIEVKRYHELYNFSKYRIIKIEKSVVGEEIEI